MLLQDQVLAALRGQVVDIISGTVFVFLGLLACGIAAMRRRADAGILVWMGIWSAMYGVLRFGDSLAALTRLPHWSQVTALYLDTGVMYLIFVVATRAWLELSRGKLRVLLTVIIYAGLVIGSAGIVVFLLTGASDTLLPYNNLLAACLIGTLLTVVAVPKLARTFLVLPDRKILLVATLIFSVEALYTSVSGSLGHHRSTIWDSLGFAVFLFSFGYVALKMVLANERRLSSIDKELAIAREIQTSILPGGSPEIIDLQITAAYHPMTAVAGDFYEFVPVDPYRVGVLIADVSGHGVPAALIAAMLKVAVKSVVVSAHDPPEVLSRLNQTFFGQARDQFVTAAYLFIDMEKHKALYSAAGHPPMLLSRAGRLERIESNGLVLGVMPDPAYPLREIPIIPGDRLLLYTDGLIEAENAKGQAFGDTRLEEIVLSDKSRCASELTDKLFNEIQAWRPMSVAQQDDITLIIIDVR